MKSEFKWGVTSSEYFAASAVRFFDLDNLLVIGHGFQKKTQKTPRQQIERAEQIKREYYESKE